MKHRRALVLPGQLDLGFRVEEMTPCPESAWRPPDLGQLPDRLGGIVGVDTETRDFGLTDKIGAGWAWFGGGEVVGASVVADNCRVYLPIAHQGGDNVDRDVAIRWLRRVLGDESTTKVFAHAQYDMGWLRRLGVEVRGRVVDVQWVDALLDENQREYNLDEVSQRRLGRRKDETLLRAAARAYGVDPKSGLWRLPGRYVGPYGEEDAALARDIWAVQEPMIEAEGLREVFDLEHDLIPLYLDMRTRGVRIDVNYAEDLARELESRNRATAERLARDYGFKASPWETAAVARILAQEGVEVGRTSTGKASVTKDFLNRCGHPLAREIVAWREAEKLLGTFLRGQILGMLHAGRVHGEIHPLKSDDGGTVTGRLSMSNPNLQFIPTRTAEGKLIRRCFLPEEGELWTSPDFSQQEPRLLVHFAYLAQRAGFRVRGAEEARRRYIDDPTMSYHDFAAELTGLEYAAAKILNLAIIYGRGIAETAAQLQISHDECRAKFQTHHREMPFAKDLSFICQDVVRERGYIRSLLGRRVRFDLWEPRDWDRRNGKMLPREAAEAVWEGLPLDRARLHKALNSLIQPSAADQTKAAMRAVWREGLGSRVLVQVHDELGCSVPDQATADRIAAIMREAVPLEVPVRVDAKVGPNWKEAK